MHVRLQLLHVHVTVALIAASIAAGWLVNLGTRAHHLTDTFASERPHIAHLRHAKKDARYEKKSILSILWTIYTQNRFFWCVEIEFRKRAERFAKFGAMCV